jgi:DNA-binding MarR family transcriptional regulator
MRRTVKGGLEQFTPGEGEAWGGFLAVHAAVTRELDADLRGQHGLSLSAYEVLLKLAWAPQGELRMTELAQQCLLTPGGITRILDTLSADRLVERRVPPENRRVVLATITDEGFSLLQRAQRTHVAGVRRRFFSQLDQASIDALGEAWRRIRAVEE